MYLSVRNLLISMGLLFAVPAVATATPLTWTFNEVAFDDGGSLTGFFIYDVDTDVFSSFEISVSGGNEGTFTPFTYDSDVAGAFMETLTNNRFRVWKQVAGRGARFRGLDPMTNAGGTIVLDVSNLNDALECFNCSPVRAITGGSISAIPEPSTAALFALGILGLAVGKRHKRA